MAALGVVVPVLFLANVVLLKKDTDLSEMRASRRYFEDTCVGVKNLLDGEYGLLPTAESPNYQKAFDACARLLAGGASRQEVRPWQFWRTIHLRPFVNSRETLVGPRPFEDPGRAILVATGFRVLGGVSPFLTLWIAVPFFLIVLWWTAWELSRAGRAVAAAVFLFLLALSPFVVDIVTFTHSGVSFYLVSMIAIVAMSSYAVFSERVTAGGVVARAAVAGAFLGISVWCRSSSMALLAGLVLALLLGARRLDRGPRRAAWAALALAALVVPSLALRPPKGHAVWISIWEGLGDFDRTKGHVLWDDDAKRTLVNAGVPVRKELLGWVSEEAELFFRGEVLKHVREDPRWFARILLRRVWATITQEKVRAWTGRDWRWIRDHLTENEGGMGKYYSWITPVNVLGLGRARVTVPVLLLMLPTAVLVALALMPPWSERSAALKPAAMKAAAVLACLAASAIVIPVAITTGSMPETEAFALVYVFGSALLVDGLLSIRTTSERTRSTLAGSC